MHIRTPPYIRAYGVLTRYITEYICQSALVSARIIALMKRELDVKSSGEEYMECGMPEI